MSHAFRSIAMSIAAMMASALLIAPPHGAFAQESDSIIPNLFVRDIQITKHNDRTIDGTFSIISKTQHPTPGVGYAVMLMSPLPEVPENELFADSPIVYDKTYIPAGLTIAAGETREIPFYYSIPSVPAGAYRIRIQLSTDNGRTMGWWDQDVTIESARTDAFVELQPTAVIIDSVQPLLSNTPEGRRGEWNPLEGVNVDPGATMQLRLDARNTSQAAFTGTLQATSANALTASPEKAVTDLGPLALASQESRQLTVPFTAPEAPGAYHVIVAAHDGTESIASSLGEYRIVVRGASASVISVTARELSFQKGEHMALTAYIVGSADAETMIQGTVEISALNGEEIVGTHTSPIELSYEPLSIDASIELTADIPDTPGARVRILDNAGSVLETYNVQFDREEAAAASDSPAAAAQDTMPVIGIAILGILAVAAGVFIWKRRKNPPISIPPAVLLLPLALGALFFAGIHTTDANHEPRATNGRPLIGIGNSLIFGNNQFGVIGSRGLTTFVNSPIHEDMVEPGTTVPYQATATFYACGNDYYYNKWFVRVASNGGKFSSHSETSWTNELTFPEDLITNSKTVLIRNVAGSIRIPETAGITDTTIWSDVSWRKDDPGKEWIPSSVMTWLNVQPKETDISIEKSTPETVGQDEDLVYTITVKNTGSVTAKNVIVRDTVPTGLGWDASRSSSECSQQGGDVECIIPSLAAGATKNLTLTFIQGSITYASTPSSPSPTPAPSVAPTYTFMYQQHPVLFLNSLGIYPTIYADSVRATSANGQKLCTLAGYKTVSTSVVRTYDSPRDNTLATWNESSQTWTTQNAKAADNPGQFDRLVCTDPISSGTPDTPTDPGTPSGPTIVRTPLTCGTSITNTATVSSDNGDPAEGNNSASTTTTVTCPPPSTDISITLLLNGSSKPAPIPVHVPATLSWSSTNADSCQALRDWSGAKAPSGSESTTPSEVRKYSYRLNCSNSATGNTAHKIVDVEVVSDGGPEQTYQCSDGIDNADPEDALADEADPGCHAGDNINNEYIPTDDNETNTGNGTDPTTYQCSDGIDNADTEDALADEADPGCHAGDNINNEYIPTDDNETNTSDGGDETDDGGNNGGGNNGGGNNGGGNNGGGNGPGGLVETR